MSSGHLGEAEKLQELLKLAQSDPELLKREYERLVNQTKPVTSEEFLDPKFDLKLDPEGGIVIEPASAFVMKSKDAKSKEKVFINVVTHPIVDEPEEKNFVDYDNQQGIRLPMSLGTLKEDFDKNKSICKVVDCVLNPSVVTTIQKTNEALNFLYQLIGNYVHQKYKIELEEEFSLPKLKYKGQSVEFQRVRGKKAPKIQTLDEDIIKNKTEASREDEILKNSLNSERVAHVDWKLFLEFEDGSSEEFDGQNENIERVQKLRVELDLPLLVTGKNITLKVSEDEIEMYAGKIYQFIVRPIIQIDPKSANASFDVKARRFILQVNKLKVLPKPEVQEQMLECNKDVKNQQITTPTLSNELLYDIL